MKKINLNSSVFTLVHQYPEIVEIMASLGFTEIRKKAVVNSVGKDDDAAQRCQNAAHQYGEH